MTDTPLSLDIAFTIGPVPVATLVVVTWAIMGVLVLTVAVLARGLKLDAGPAQTVLELLVATLDAQIEATLQRDPAPYRVLVGTLFFFILAANWVSLVPGVDPPTAHLETDAALAAIVFVATIFYGIKSNGVIGYLKTFAEPTWVMVPLNLVEQITRTFSLMVRLFGNVMSGAFVVGIVLSLAGLLVPIPLMALDLLTGAVQAYIFAVLSTVFIAAAIGDEARSEAPSAGTIHITKGS
ncbi:F0F1 ATP synthase subunit A [Thalassovita taeanensis]|uniref:ATP synthase subunit a n=1 Tax=Thalassovita taeanensis TaxID=657014 RepID=A0A1H9HBP6_9RHOB|nr:F0F1 ATP synthase subunit A [Thalassovita taeanensis]SEQ59781.1 ATP synthase F0 subcomplex A subunit [Thalassovita taeanensis]